ncbi:MAG: ribosome small subunit-dependent GTPase A [Tenericutes bacterium]|nr:ribosome small subunit-dependent GTPase A [Mycoplasmatota bacterium]
MSHYNAYASFKTKKSIEKKELIKEKQNKQIILPTDFIIEKSSNYGIVLEVKYKTAYVLYNNEIISATLKKGINTICNKIIFPGDKVIIEKTKMSYTITNLLRRTSILSRVKKDSTRPNDLGTTKNIASNIDLAVIVASAKDPALHPKFIDRYLLLLENSNIPTIICLNKSDLKTEETEKILGVYRNLGLKVIETSTYTNQGITNLKEELRGKQAIFIGNSGVGKSSLTNALMDTETIKTSTISSKSKRGRHTTTSSKYYIWDEDSSIIDTPGIRSLDVSNLNPIEIQNYFKEFSNIKEKCKYKNCLHYQEPTAACTIKQAVENNTINKNRYQSYLRILKDTLNDK